MCQLYKKLINKLLRQFGINSISSEGKVVYLTFDDGPELGITEFVLAELAKFDFKATFFCRGDNAEKHPELLSLLLKEGHAIGNHTYSHLHAYENTTNTYIKDIEKADIVLQTNLFRPPHGSLTFSTWWRLRSRKIIFWSLNSKDSNLIKFNSELAIDNLKSRTQPGDVVLFHFCHRHEKETKQVLPAYLKWLSDNGFKAVIIDK